MKPSGIFINLVALALSLRCGSLIALGRADFSHRVHIKRKQDTDSLKPESTMQFRLPQIRLLTYSLVGNSYQ